MVLCFASQVLGKTEIINCLIGWEIEQGTGGGMMMVEPTVLMAQSWSKLKLQPMLVDLGVTGKSRTNNPSDKNSGSESIQLKEWSNTYLVVGGANSPAALAMYTCKRLYFDEVDRYPPTVATRGNVEGDPLTVTQRRTESFGDSFEVETSTPTTKGLSRIENDLENTDYRKWFVTCSSCAKEWVILFDHIKWPKELTREGKRHLVREAYLECPHCQAHHSDSARKAMVKKGRWVATKPENENAPGFWANAFLTLLPHKKRYKNRLHQWAAEWLAAEKRGPDAVRIYVNQVKTEAYEEPTERPTAPENLYNRRETYPEKETLPAEVLTLVAGVDTQDDRFEVTVVGVGAGEQTWVIDHVVFSGNLAEPIVWTALGNYLKGRWDHPSGHQMTLRAIGMDTGGHNSKRVHQFVRRAGLHQLFALVGVRGVAQPWVQRSKKSRGLINVYSQVGKAIIYSRLGIIEPQDGYIHFGNNLDLAYFEQLLAERIVTVKEGRQWVRRFECPPGRRNEALDAFCYALAALERLPVNWKQLAAYYAVKPVEVEEKPVQPEAKPAQPKPLHRMQRPRRVWGSGLGF